MRALLVSLAIGAGWLAHAPLSLAQPARAGAPAAAPAAPGASGGAAAGTAANPAAGKERELGLQASKRLGDFDAMVQRRALRVLIPYSRSLFFVDQGRERGLAVSLVREFERYVNQKYAKELGKRPLTVFVIATPRDQLFAKLNDGYGDIAAGNLTVTPERQKIVDFVAPRDRTPVREVVVTGPASPALSRIEDLSGRKVHFRPTSSYHDSLLALNAKLRAAGKAPVDILPLPERIEDEDALEMVNAGILPMAVVDDWVAQLWAEILPGIKVRNDLVLRAEGYTGWAIRKDSPKLQAVIEEFYASVVRRQGGIDARIAAAHKRIRQIANNTGSAELKRFTDTVALFQKYGHQYGFDPLMLAAQGFQESRLDQNAKSAVGAIGVMQLMPATGAEMKVGDIRVTEPNIHAGTKYMDQLMSRYFRDANFSEQDRTLFAFAAYNAGPGNIAGARKEAQRRGLDPNRWFDNVELVVADRIGLETTTYVRNIYKYFAAYRLTVEEQAASRKARESLAPAPR
jgi:membrane-bound lytic murein transglycosylase MltF